MSYTNVQTRGSNGDPFVKRSTLDYLTRGETPSVRAVALQLHFGMVTALRSGDGSIHATWREVADWAGVSYASVKRAIIRLRELGWVRELGGHRIVFNYRRSCPVKKAQSEPPPSSYLETFQEGITSHPKPPASAPEAGSVALEPSGRDALQEQPKKPSEAGQAIAVLVEAGADRAGAVKAVKAAKREGRLSLMTIQRIADAVAALPSKPYRPGGLICAAIVRPELGAKLIRDHASAMRRKPSRMPQEPSEALQAPGTPPEASGTILERLMAVIAEPEDLAFMMHRHGVSPQEVRELAARNPRVRHWAGWV